MLPAKPSEMHPLFESAFNAGDLDRLAALYEENAVLIADGQSVAGRERIRAAFDGWLTSRGRMTLATISTVDSPEGLAVLQGRWSIESGPGGGPATHGISTEVLRRQADGTWLFVIDNPHALE